MNRAQAQRIEKTLNAGPGRHGILDQRSRNATEFMIREAKDAHRRLSDRPRAVGSV